MNGAQVERHLGRCLSLSVDGVDIDVRVSAIDPVVGLVTLRVLTAGFGPVRQQVPCALFLEAIEEGALEESI
jgi:hypothetical protein